LEDFAAFESFVSFGLVCALGIDHRIARLWYDSGTPVSRPLASRAALVAEIRARLLSESFPRVTMVVVVAIAGGGAFLFSALTLAAGLHSMPVRYGLAALVGYLAFAGLIRAWIAWQRGRLEPDFDLLDLNLSIPSGRSGVGPSLFTGGRSGGGGASMSWAGDGPAPVAMPVIAPPPPSAGGAAVESVGHGASKVFDADDLWPVILAAVLALGAIVAVGFVVVSAPTLLAEVALDAGLMSTVYRRLRRQDAGHWSGAVLRRTWLPALAVVLITAGAGYALQLAAPEARSIGGVIRSLAGE
jgi:hypothetical protein